MASAEEVDVEVGDGLAAVGAVVDCDAEAGFGDAEFPCDLRSGEEKVAEDGLVFGGGFADARDGLLRDDENMHRCLRGNVPERAAEIVLVEDVGGDFPFVDFLEKSFHVRDDVKRRNPDLKP